MSRLPHALSVRNGPLEWSGELAVPCTSPSHPTWDAGPASPPTHEHRAPTQHVGISDEQLDYMTRALIRCEQLSDALRIGTTDAQSPVPLRLIEANKHDYALLWDALHSCMHQHGSLRDEALLQITAGQIWNSSPDYSLHCEVENVRDLITTCY